MTLKLWRSITSFLLIFWAWSWNKASILCCKKVIHFLSGYRKTFLTHSFNNRTLNSTQTINQFILARVSFATIVKIHLKLTKSSFKKFNQIDKLTWILIAIGDFCQSNLPGTSIFQIDWIFCGFSGKTFSGWSVTKVNISSPLYFQ